MNQIPTFEQVLTMLAPVVAQLEVFRKELLQNAKKKSMLLGSLVLVVVLFIAFALGWSLGFGLLLALLLVILVTGIVFHLEGGLLSPRYKKELIGKLVEELIENGKYEPQEGLSEEAFRQTDLFNRPDRYHSEDLISGQAGKTSFCFAEVHAEERHTTTNSKGQTRTTWTTLFKGFMFVADFNKDFAGHTVVLRDSFLNFARGNRVKLENVEFEKHFDVFSTDQVEARYILTPSMMERILGLDKVFGQDLLLSFLQSKVVIMVKSSRNHFESSLTRSVNERATLQEEYNTIISLISLIEALDLNTRIWSKE